MENENPAPTTRQLFACWFTLCRAISRIGTNGDRAFNNLNQEQEANTCKYEANIAKQYADELMKREPR